MKHIEYKKVEICENCKNGNSTENGTTPNYNENIRELLTEARTICEAFTVFKNAQNTHAEELIGKMDFCIRAMLELVID